MLNNLPVYYMHFQSGAFTITFIIETSEQQMLTEKLIANRIRAVREEKNYTQFYVAYKLNVSQNTFSKIELGNVKLTLARLIEIAKVLEVDLVDFLRDEHLHIIVR